MEITTVEEYISKLNLIHASKLADMDTELMSEYYSLAKPNICIWYRGETDRGRDSIPGIFRKK